MKKILFALLSVFMCSVAMADVKGFNDITDTGKIYWEAVDAAVSVFDSEETRAIMYAFFIDNEGKELSAKDILTYCRQMEKDVVKCANFVKNYVSYTGGDASNCTMASGIIGQEFDVGGYSIYANTFNDAMRTCTNAEKGSGEMSNDGRILEDFTVGATSMVGTCLRFIGHVKKCTRHLESYYAKELSKTDLDAKKKKQYSCILNLVQTGQLELPVNLMEKKCK